jgi:hypothetical protein
MLPFHRLYFASSRCGICSSVQPALSRRYAIPEAQRRGGPWFPLDGFGRARVKHLIHEYPAYDLMSTLTRQDQLFGPALDWFVLSSLQEHKDNAPGPASDLASYLAFCNKPLSLFSISPRSNDWP